MCVARHQSLQRLTAKFAATQFLQQLTVLPVQCEIFGLSSWPPGQRFSCAIFPTVKCLVKEVLNAPYPTGRPSRDAFAVYFRRLVDLQALIEAHQVLADDVDRQ